MPMRWMSYSQSLSTYKELKDDGRIITRRPWAALTEDYPGEQAEPHTEAQHAENQRRRYQLEEEIDA